MGKTGAVRLLVEARTTGATSNNRHCRGMVANKIKERGRGREQQREEWNEVL